MRFLVLLSPLLLAMADPGPSSRPSGASPPTATASAPTSQSAALIVQPELQAKVDRLVAGLASPSFKERESAQTELRKLGEAAMLPLLKYIDSPDLEVAERVSTLVVRPTNPEVRIEVAYRLLTTGRPHLMEPAVYMLFEEPLVDFEPFARRARSARGLAQAVAEPVVEQLKSWKTQTEIFQRNYERFLKTKPEAAEQQSRLHEGSEVYNAEAAYWQAVGAAEDYLAPKQRSPEPTTKSAE